MKNTLIWVTNKNIIDKFGLNNHGHKFNVVELDTNNTEFRIIAREMKKTSSDRIVKISDNYRFEVIMKKNSVWSSVKFDDLVSNWMIYNNFFPKANEFHIPKLLRNKKETEIEFPFLINENNLLYYKDVILFYLEDGSIKKTIEFNDNSYSTINTSFKLENSDSFVEFSKLVLNSKPKGLSFDSSRQLENGVIELKTRYGEIFISINKENIVNIYGVLSTQHINIAELFAFCKGMNTNITNYVKREETPNVPLKKITKRNIFTWTLSLLVIILSLWITFNLIFDPMNVGMAFKIMSSGYSWTHAWIYLLIINFLISLFIIPIVAIVFLKAQDPKKKINFKQQINIFISAQIRMVAAFLTGNAMLATIIWGWYLNSSRGIKVVSFVGMVVSINIIRGIIIIPVGIMFMIRGTIFNHTIFSELGLMNQYYAFVTLSWIGWIWHTLEHLAMTMLIIIPPLHILYNKILFVRYRNQKNSNIIIDKFTTFEMNLVSLKHSFKKIFKDRQRLMRMIITMIIVIVLETFEFTFGLRVVEDYAHNIGYISQTASYWNVFAISGVRYMSGFIRSVPIIELIPGQGLGFTDLVLNSYTKGVIFHAHIADSFSTDQVNSLSQQTTFIMRFFNFYLKRLIALLICMVVVPRAIFNKNKRIKEGGL